jgi:ribosomal protein S18 acetylase RimI-like enzyme
MAANKTVSSLNSRLYEIESDLKDVLLMLMLGRSRTNDWHYPHIGEFLFNYFMVACHLDVNICIRLWYHHSHLIAYAILGEDPSFECQVLPEYEWSGIEAEAFRWALETLDKFRQRFAQEWKGSLVSSVRQDNLKRIAFLEQKGFCYRGQFTEVNMIRSLDEPLPHREIPEGFQVRTMTQIDNIGERARVHREVWQPWSVGNISADDYLRFMRLPGYMPELDVVTLAAYGTMAAYVNGWIDPINRIGDLGPVGARPAFRQQGLTRLAMLESLRRMQALGMERVCVSTGVSNMPAMNLYSSLGFKVVNKYLDYGQEE